MNAFDEYNLNDEQERTISAFLMLTADVHHTFRHKFESHLREQYRSKFYAFPDSLLDIEEIQNYCQKKASEDFLSYDSFLIDFTLYSLILDEANKNLDTFWLNLEKYHKENKSDLSFTVMEQSLYLSLNIVLSVNLKKILDNILTIVYSLNLSNEHDNSLINKLLERVFLYNKRFSNLYMDRHSGGQLSFYKFDSKWVSRCADPIVISYHIDRRKVNYERKY